MSSWVIRFAVGGIVLAASAAPQPGVSAATVGSWSEAPDLISPRIGHAATLLTDGRVLLTGGANAAGTATSTAELYDPRANRWFPASGMSAPRAAHTSTLLSDGSVLVAGGQSALDTFPIDDLSSAEIYHPGSNTWTPAASMHVARSRHNAVRLHDGRILLVGGFIEPPAGAPPPQPVLEQAEVYDPDRNAWSLVGGGLPFVSGQALTLMSSGEALVSGGAIDGVMATNQVELFDPATNRWRPMSGMVTPRFGHTATLLVDGSVFVTGGVSTSAASADPNVFPVRDFLKTSEILEFGGLAGAPGLAPFPRLEHTATLLRNGMVLVVGSAYASNADSQLFDAGNPSRWISTGMAMDRYLHTATLLVDGRVLIAGGYGIGSANTAWLFSPNSLAQTTAPSPAPLLPIAAVALLLGVLAIVVVATSGRWRRRTTPSTTGADTEWIDP